RSGLVGVVGRRRRGGLHGLPGRGERRFDRRDELRGIGVGVRDVLLVRGRRIRRGRQPVRAGELVRVDVGVRGWRRRGERVRVAVGVGFESVHGAGAVCVVQPRLSGRDARSGGRSRGRVVSGPDAAVSGREGGRGERRGVPAGGGGGGDR